MKRILFFVLACLMLVSAVSCAPSLAGEELTDTTVPTEPSVTETAAQITSGKESLVIPQGYAAGYSRVKITPTRLPIPLASDADAKTVRDDLYLSCVAISDGDEVAFLIHMDLKRCSLKLYQAACRVIEQETGVPADHVFVNSTHTHNSPDPNLTDSWTTLWMSETLYPAFRKVARAAYKDLSEAEMYIGRADTTHYAHVRRYICEDGTLDGIHMAFTTGSPIKQHESLADPELQVIQFRRKDPLKKDITMVNWQAHAAHANTSIKDQITSDFVHYMRQDTELLTGTHFAYYNGASGNINLSSKISGLQKYTWTTVGQAIAKKVKEACETAEKAEMGEIKAAAGGYEATYRTYSEQRIAEAKLCNKGTEAEKAANRAKYKFQSKYEVTSIINLSSYTTDTFKIPLAAITFGDVAFAAASYEMFDTNGQQVKEGSPHKMTFICAYTNGHYGYIPSEFGYSQGGYETSICKYISGTGEKCAEELLRLIREAV